MFVKDFNRAEYLGLVGTKEVAPRLREGDLLVVTSLDRLGRNYDEIREQWRHITYELKANIKVLDMPLLDTSISSDLDRKFMCDLVLQILAYVAERERVNIRKRQAEGIASAKARGKNLGRRPVNLPEKWDETIKQVQDGEITSTEAMKALKLKKTTYYKLLKGEVL
jgi:DNA invertase Pin-like site-specific DNA recombinase